MNECKKYITVEPLSSISFCITFHEYDDLLMENEVTDSSNLTTNHLLALFRGRMNWIYLLKFLSVFTVYDTTAANTHATCSHVPQQKKNNPLKFISKNPAHYHSHLPHISHHKFFYASIYIACRQIKIPSPRCHSSAPTFWQQHQFEWNYLRW